MGKWLVRRQLKATSTRIRRLRDELAIIDEQFIHLPTEADEEAMSGHRRHVLAEIASLEARQDDLLDRIGPG